MSPFASWILLLIVWALIIHGCCLLCSTNTHGEEIPDVPAPTPEPVFDQVEAELQAIASGRIS